MTGCNDRRELIQQLNRRTTQQDIDDLEQVAYLEQWRISGKRDYAGYVVLIIAGVIGLFITLQIIKGCEKEPVQKDCGTCHSPDLSTLRKYKAHHQGKK